MNAGKNPSRTVSARRIVAAMAAVVGSALIASPLLAQGSEPDNQSQAPVRSAPRLGGVKSQGGVRSQPARPSSGLGGVKAGFPQTNKPVMRSSPETAYKPMRVGPFPGVVNTPIPQSSGPSSGPRVDPRLSPGYDPRLDPRVRGSLGEGYWRGGRYGGVVTSGSGLSINGAFNDDNWRLRFHVGGPTGQLIPSYSLVPGDYGHVVYLPPWNRGANWWYNDYSYADYGHRYPLIQGVYPEPSQPRAAQPEYQAMTEAVTPSDNRELGDVYLMAGDAKAAATAYRAHLAENPDDAQAMRGLGLALLDLNQLTEAVAMVGMAYRASPELADSPVPVVAFGGTAREMRENLRRASLYANQTRSASAWLTLAVLMQAEGRSAVARTMLDRARAAGLDESVYRRMQSALVS